MRKRAGAEEVTKDTSSTLQKLSGERSSYDAVMSLPDEIFESESSPASAYMGTTETLASHTEDIPETIALELIGENQKKPNCVYKMVSTPYHTCVVQYDTTKDKDDPEYSTEYELEEYREGYKPGIDEGSVSSGFWQAGDVPKTINTTAIVCFILAILFFLGVAGIALLLSWQ